MRLTREQEVIRDAMRAIVQAPLWPRAARGDWVTRGGAGIRCTYFDSYKRLVKKR